MKILIISHRHWYHIAHGAERFLPISRYLAEKGHHVTILYMGRELNVHPELAIDLSATRKFWVDEERRLQLSLLPDIHWRNSPAYYLIESLYKPGLALSSLLDNYDIVHTEFFFRPPIALSTLFMRTFLGTPHIVDFVDLIPHLKPGISLMKSLGYFPTWATVCSQYLKDFLLNLNFSNESVFRVPMGADTEKIRSIDKMEARERLKLDKEGPLLGYEFGTGMHDDYLELILRSFHRVLIRKNRAKLLLVGDFGKWNWKGRILEKIAGNSLGSNVIFSGTLRTADLSWWLSASDVLLLPLSNTAYDQSKFPGRMGDYLASGRPIVGTAVGELTSVIGRGCGLLASPGDQEDFSSKILTILDDPKAGEQMGIRARALAETEYSWKNISNQVETIYKKVFKG